MKAFCMILFIVCTFSTHAQKPRADVSLDSTLAGAMKWRSIGPFRGGRSLAVAGHEKQTLTYYFGATGGGVWKTTDGGATWFNVSDGYFKSSSVGALEIAASDPNVLYAGTGESCIRGNISVGDGVYRSLDAGRTWTHMGLRDAQTISRIAIDPRNPDLVMVAALGKIFGANKERGIYRTTDGGKTWALVLSRDDKTGGVDVAIDPFNPRNVYAALWEASRTPWSMSSGGPGSGLFRSTDGGQTWKEISTNPGLPRGVIGKIGIAISPAREGRIWTSVEAEHGGVFRSDDAGETWQRVNEDRALRQRAWYYSHIVADPLQPDVVYVLNVNWHKSLDGGKTFQTMPTMHGDHHDLWIDPTDPRRMILADDGGAVVSINGGETWTDQDLPTAQFYHVLVDNQFPYNVYGAQQDNSTIQIASRSTGYGIDATHWRSVAGGESGYIAVHPEKPHITYGGSYQGYLTRFDSRTQQERIITVWPDNVIGQGAVGARYRFQWTFPIMLSPHDPNVLYATSQFVHRSTDEGQTWEIVSPDLTRNDSTKQRSSGGPITKDNTGVEYYNTIFAFAESPITPGLLWAGSDDGLIHVSRDGGKTWQNVTPKNLGEGSLISQIEPSPWDAGTAYVAVNRYKRNDPAPYIWITNDHGKSWKNANAGIAADHFVRVVREDPHRKGLLYAGTERGMYLSFNSGSSWTPFQLNLPQTPIHDIAVHKRDQDLIVATHGRSFWILDDLTPLHEWSDKVVSQTAYLFRPRDAYRMEGFPYDRPGLSIGLNPPNGVLVHYFLRQKPTSEVKLEFVNTQGQTMATFSSIKDAKGKELKPSEEFYEKPKEKRQKVVPADSGMNRFVWDMRIPDATEVPGGILWFGSLQGPKVIPGEYRVRLTLGQSEWTQSFRIKIDPRVDVGQDVLEQQADLMMQIHRALDTTHKTVNKIRDVKKQIADYASRLKDTTVAGEIRRLCKPLQDSLSQIEDVLIQSKLKSSQDVLNYPVRLNNRLATLAATISNSDDRPTQSQSDLFLELRAAVEESIAAADRVLKSELPKIQDYTREHNVPALSVE